MRKLGYLANYSGNPFKPRNSGTFSGDASDYFDERNKVLPPEVVTEYIPEYIRYKAGFPYGPRRTNLRDPRTFNVLML
jgi:hypothetical protein